MNITRENTDALNAVIKLSVEEADYSEKVSTVIKDYKKKARIDGFRPGKVPEGLIRKMYGKAILLEEVNKVISESLTKYIQDEKLQILGEPLACKEQPKTPDFDNDKEFEFTFDIAIAPEVEVQLSKRDKVVLYDIKADDKMIDQFAESYTKRFGAFAEKDVVEESAVLKGKYTQLDENQKALEGGVTVEEVTISLDAMKDEDIKKLFDAKKVGDKVVFNVRKAYPNDSEISAMLKVEKEKAAEIDGDFEYEITKIEKFEDAEINQELFDKAFGEGEIKSEEEFRNKLTEEINVNLSKESEYRFGFDAKEKLVSKFKFDLPEEFLKRWLLESNQGKLTEEQIENDFDAFAKDLRWQLIKETIIKTQEFKVEENEVMDTAKQITLAQFQQYGLSHLPDEQLENYAKEILKKQDEVRKIYEKIFEDKVIAYVKETVKVDPKEVTSEEFQEIWKKDTEKAKK